MTQPSLRATPDMAHPFVLYLGVFVAFLLANVILSPLLGLRLGSLATQIAAIAGGAWVYRRLVAPTGRRWPSGRTLGMSAPVAVAATAAALAIALLANLLGALTVELIPSLKPMAAEYQKLLNALLFEGSVFDQVVGAVAVALVAPLCEEYMFRGTLLAEQRVHSPARTAIVLNALLFSLMHLNPIAFVPLAMVGAYLAHLTLLTGSLWPAILGHATINTLNGVVLPRVAGEWANPEHQVALADVFLAMLVVGPLAAGLWWWVARRLRGARESAPL